MLDLASIICGAMIGCALTVGAFLVWAFQQSLEENKRRREGVIRGDVES